MSDTPLLSGERSNSKVAAVFATAQAASAAAREVAATLGLGDAQVQLLTPGEVAPGRRLEPESHGIWRTIVIAHARLGVLGMVVGLLVFAVLLAMGIAFVERSPIASALVLLGFGGVAGLMLGGLVALRPDHDRYVLAARDAMDEGRPTVVVHAFSAGQADQAAEVLRALGGDVTATL